MREPQAGAALRGRVHPRSYRAVAIVTGLAVAAGLLLASWVTDRSPASDDGSITVEGMVLGLVPGQELRVSVADPGSRCAHPGRGQPREPLSFVATFVGPDGTTLLESEPTEVPEGGFGVVEADHRDLRANGVRAAGEEHTGRREVLTLVELVNCHPRGSGPGPTATLQLVDTGSGRTQVVARWKFENAWPKS